MNSILSKMNLDLSKCASYVSACLNYNWIRTDTDSTLTVKVFICYFQTVIRAFTGTRISTRKYFSLVRTGSKP